MNDFGLRSRTILGGAGAAKVSRRAGLRGVVLAAFSLLAWMSCPEAARASEGARPTTSGADTNRPVVVLVHGAWADGSSWSKVISRLQADGYTVVAPAIRMASLSDDIAATRKFISDLHAPVLLVGHSYGGAVITGAASGLTFVKGLVFLAAFAPDTGESVLALIAQFDNQFGPSRVGPVLRPDGPLDNPQTLIYLDRAQFGDVFAQDVGRERAALLAAAQRPASAASFGEPLQVTPAWRQIRSWYQVSTQDRVIQPDGERSLAHRIGAETIEVDSSHASPVAHPEVIARLIEKAAQSSN